MVLVTEGPLFNQQQRLCAERLILVLRSTHVLEPHWRQICFKRRMSLHVGLNSVKLPPMKDRCAQFSSNCWLPKVVHHALRPSCHQPLFDILCFTFWIHAFGFCVWYFLTFPSMLWHSTEYKLHIQAAIQVTI